MDLSGRRLGEFTLREQIGEGGCAVVYRCEQPQLRRSAVVKVLHERGQRSDAALDRFRREAQLASQLDHPYAAHVYAFGEVRLESSPAYTARWVDGGRAILSTHADGAARLWSANGVLRRTYTGAARFLAEADLSPDGTMVVGGGGDGMLRFWDAVTGQPLWVVAAHRPYVMGLHFEAGDLVTRGIGGEVSRWSLPPADAVIRGGTAPAR